MAQECVVCGIVADADPDVLVHRDDRVAAFLDHRPLFKGHLLVVPVEHVGTLDQLPTPLLTPLFTVVQTAIRALEAAVDAQGAFVANNNKVSQSLPHLHVHVVPRRPKDGLRGFFWPRTSYDDDADRVDHVRRLRAAFEELSADAGAGGR